MKLIKISHLIVLFLALTCAIMFPSGNVNAGTWDYLGQYNMSTYVYSTGGDFMACTSHRETVHLWEHDPDNPHDHVGSRYPVWNPTYGGWCSIWRGISGYVDGDNDRAEFYITGYQSTWVKFYD
jgi:hypothetical protein